MNPNTSKGIMGPGARLYAHPKGDNFSKVVMLRSSGWSFNEIARQLGISKQRAHELYQKYLNQKETPNHD